MLKMNKIQITIIMRLLKLIKFIKEDLNNFRS